MKNSFAVFRRAFRFLCSPIGLAALVYAFVAMVLAGWLPYQPAIVIPRPEQCRMLVGFSSDGSRLAAGPVVLHISTGDRLEGLPLPDDPFWIWNISSGRAHRQDIKGNLESQILVSLALNPTSRQKLWWRYIDNIEWRTRFVAHNPFAVEMENPQWRSQLPTIFHRGFAFSNDLRLIVRACRDGNGSDVVAWDSKKTLAHITELPDSVVFLAGGQSVASASVRFKDWESHPRYRVERRNLESGTQVLVTEWEDRSSSADGRFSPGHIELSPDGRWLVDIWQPRARLQAADGLIVWDASNGSLRFEVPSAKWFCCANQGRTLVSLHDHESWPGTPRVRILDLENGNVQLLLPSSVNIEVHERVPVAEANGTGRWLAIAVDENRANPLDGWHRLDRWLWSWGIDLAPSLSDVVLFDLQTDREVARLGGGPEANHLSSILETNEPTMAFSQDGRRLAVLAEDAIRIWDLPPPSPWFLILTLPLIPAAPFLFFAAWRRFRAPNFAVIGV